MEETRISAAEWVILRSLWAQGPQSGSALTELLAPQYFWNRSTISTFLRRLEEKGYILVDKSQRPFLFAPALSRKRGEQELVARFCQQYFAGDWERLLRWTLQLSRQSGEGAPSEKERGKDKAKDKAKRKGQKSKKGKKKKDKD